MLLVGGACSLIAASAAAKYPFRPPAPEPYPEWQPHIELEDAWGEPLRRFRFGAGVYVLGEVGERYVVRVHNPTSERIEAVVSIDGRDAVSGRVADYRRQRGYIVPAYGSIVVDGFRRSLGEVSAFRFSDPSDSYSARRGTPENVGVVGAAFFRERRFERRPEPPLRPRYRPTPPPDYRRDEAPRAAAPREGASAKSPAPPRKPEARRSPSAERAPSDSVNNLGTEYAEVRESRVHETSFERRLAEPSWVVTLRYDDAEGLRSRGIEIALPPRPVSEPVEPQAFPDSRFAAPPPE